MTNDELIKKVAYLLNNSMIMDDDCYLDSAKEIIALVTAHNRQSLMDKILNLPATKHDRRVFYQLTERLL